MSVSHTSHVTRHTSHVTRHTSHVTRHTSHLTRHSSHTLGWLSVSEILDNLGYSCFQEIAGGVLPS
jgi:hypothetical protein